MKRKTWLITVFIIIGMAVLIYADPDQFFTKAILKLTGYYSAPRYLTSQDILNKARHEDLIYDNLYKLKSYQTYKEFTEQRMIAVPFVQIYDKHKKLLTLASGSDCSWALMNFFSKEDSLALIAGDSLMYNYVTDRLEPIDIRSIRDTFQYYILAGWANYVPKLSARLFTQTNEMKKTLNNKVRLSYINFDLQKGWEAEKDSMEDIQ